MQNEVDKGIVNDDDKLIKSVSDVDMDSSATRRDGECRIGIFLFVVVVVSVGPGD